jgi:hypothetical protein
MATSSQNIPGMEYPTQKAMLAGNPRDSAYTAMTNSNQNQANANKLMAGGKIKRTHKGGQNAINVPQYQMLYEPQGGNGTNPNNQIQTNLQTSTQISANKVYDNYASIKGGSSRRKKGGNTNWLWGCMSGGKHSKESKKHTRSKKSKKHTRRNKSKNSHKK